MIRIRRYSTADHDHVWRIHLLCITEAGVEPTHQHYHDIFHIEEQYIQDGGEFLVGTNYKGNILAMGGLKNLGGQTAEIKRLRVHPNYQRRGYGQILLNKLEQQAVMLGFKQIYMDALDNQFGAHQLFRNNKYVEIGPDVVDGFNVIIFEKSFP